MIRVCSAVLLLLLSVTAGCCCSCCAPYDYCGPACAGECGGACCHSVHRSGSAIGGVPYGYGEEMEMGEPEEVPEPMPYYENGPDAPPAPPMPNNNSSAQRAVYRRVVR